MAIDQLSKWWILEGLDLPSKGSVQLLPFLSLTMVWNTGISMGLSLGDALGKWGIVVMTAGLSLWLTVWLIKTHRSWEALGLSLIVSGALGNLIDRFLHGAVVDFIHLHAFDYNFYVFNVADSAITIGVVILLIDSLREGSKSPKKASNTNDLKTDRQGD
jgi:signal peptidase II